MSTLTRRSDAVLHLHQLVRQRALQPFAWGVSDCAIWAFDALHAVTSCDVVADLRGTYSTAAGAMQLLRQHRGLAGLLQARVGRRLPAGAQQVGDVCLLARRACQAVPGEPETGALGVMWHGVVLAQGPQHLVQVPLSDARLWWGVR